MSGRFRRFGAGACRFDEWRRADLERERVRCRVCCSRGVSTGLSLVGGGCFGADVAFGTRRGRVASEAGRDEVFQRMAKFLNLRIAFSKSSTNSEAAASILGPPTHPPTHTHTRPSGPRTFLNFSTNYAVVRKSGWDIIRRFEVDHDGEVGELCGEAAEAGPSAAQLPRDQKSDVIQQQGLQGDRKRRARAVFVARIFLPTSNG